MDTTESSVNNRPNAENKIFIVGIGASAGGIQALKIFFEHVPKDSGMAYVVILHLSPDHDSKLAEIIRVVAKMPVIQVSEKTHVAANTIYVVPPNQHLSMSDGFIIVSPNLQFEDRRAPVDIFFRTLAKSHGSHAICVILSGTGANGSMGLRRAKEMGGAVFVQDPREAEFNEMPRNAIATDFVDAILLIADIPNAIINYKNNLGISYIKEEVEGRDNQQNLLKEIFNQLRIVTGHDFSNYKRPTLLRRIERRITVKNLPDIESYTVFIKQHPEETNALLKDLLISVTNFFRDPKVFDVLQSEILPSIIKKKTVEDEVRIWVAGCATGEEAYSIAILCAEQISNIIAAPKIQIFATDIDTGAIENAREGFYSLNEAADVSPERLRRFFNKEGEGYRVRKELREMILFAKHNFIKDPPFSHLDLVSCRNVLIYLNRTAQQRVMETFHFALNSGGYLFLGTSESVDSTANLYDVFNRDQHIYQTRQVAMRAYPVPESVPFMHTDNSHTSIQKEKSSRFHERITFLELHQRILEQYSSPSLIINEEYEVVHLSEKASQYLLFSSGEPSQNLLKVIRPELRLEIRSALYQAIHQKISVEAKGIKVKLDSHVEILNVHIKPVFLTQDIAKGYILVIFEKSEKETNDNEVVIRSDDSVSRHLEEELIVLKAQLRNADEHHEFQEEELKASNEELQAMNEEIRSAAEELETSREELQSMNEELRTVNQELKIKIEETTLNSNNLRNLINSASIGTIFLDRSLRIAMFTPAVLEIFNLIPGDFGRPLSDITHNMEYNDLLSDAEKVIEKLGAVEREIKTINGHIFIMNILPYRTAEDQINGVVITFVDITQRKKSELALAASEGQLRYFITATYDTVFKMNADWSEMQNIKGMYFIDGANDSGKKWVEKYIPADERKKMMEAIQNAIQNKSVFELEHKIIKEDRTIGWAISRAVPVINKQKEITEWFGAASDITLRKKSEEELRRSEERFRLMSETGLLGIAFFNFKGTITEANNHFLEMIGYDLKQFDNAIINLDKLTPPEWQAKTTEAMKALEENGIFIPFEREFIRQDGKRFWGLFGGAKFAGRNEGLAFLLDITALKILEQQKDSFIGIASHELKTPVTSIKVYAEVLQEKFENDPDPVKSEMIKKLNEQIDRLNNLISNLLDTSKISEGKLMLHLQDFDINELIREQVEELQRVSDKHQLKFNPSKLKLINADRERIAQVLTNLIFNAIRYSPNGGEVNISTEKIDNGIKVSVKDNGIGIPAALVKNIFERFFRVNNPQIQNYPGMGLGLYISAGIIERHGGSIFCESKENEGSLFYFILPYSNA